MLLSVLKCSGEAHILITVLVVSTMIISGVFSSLNMKTASTSRGIQACE